MEEMLNPIVELILNQVLSLVILFVGSYLFIKGVIVPRAVYTELTKSIVTELAKELRGTFQDVLDAQCAQCKAREMAERLEEGPPVDV